MAQIKRMTIAEAEGARRAGQPWCIYIENTTPGHNKFWQASCLGRGHQVEIRWGKIGSDASPLVKDWAYVQEKAPKKLGEGYRYVMGMSFVPGGPPPHLAAPPPAPKAPETPFARVRFLRAIKDAAGKLSGWDALDDKREHVLRLSADGGRDFAKKYPVQILNGNG